MDSSQLVAQLGQALQLLEGVLGKLPAPIAASVRADVAELRELLFEQRAPRIAITGPADAELNDVLQALMGGPCRFESSTPTATPAAQWDNWTAGLHEVSVLDARRLSAEVLTAAVRDAAPDLVLDVGKHSTAEAVREELAAQIGHVPKQARVQLARIGGIQPVQRQVAGDLTRATSSIAAGVAAVPIPVADIAPITAIQASLVAGIAYIGGRQLTPKSAAEFVGALGANIGAALVLRHVARAVAKAVVPAAGSLVSAGVAWAGTKAVGAAASVYFIDKVSRDEARRRFDVVVKEPPRLPAALGGAE